MSTQKIYLLYLMKPITHCIFCSCHVSYVLFEGLVLVVWFGFSETGFLYVTLDVPELAV